MDLQALRESSEGGDDPTEGASLAPLSGSSCEGSRNGHTSVDLGCAVGRQVEQKPSPEAVGPCRKERSPCPRAGRAHAPLATQYS
jgi:hypothetical protein